jgi:outer membrane receptor for ferrienterochelin and colicins
VTTKRSRNVCVAALVCTAAGTSAAQPAPETDIQDLVDLLETPVDVATASLEKQGQRTAPAVVEVITAADIQRWGYRTVAEVLTHVVGFYVVDDHILPNIAVRGISGGLGAESSVIKLLIDGRHANFRSTTGAWLGAELIPLTAVERIEIIRGPASAMYGADAFLGVINIVTRNSWSAGHAEVRVIAGRTVHAPSLMYDSTAMLLDDKGVKLLVGVSREEADRSGLTLPASSPNPVVPDYNRGAITARGLERRSSSVIAKLGYAAQSDTGKLREATLTARYMELTRGGDFIANAPLAFGLDANGRQNGSLISLDQVAVALDSKWRLGPHLDLVAATDYFQGRSRGDERIEVGSDLFYFRRNLAFRGVNTKAELNWQMPRVAWVAGVELTRDREDIGNPTRVLKIDNSVTTLPADPLHTLTNAGAYLQSEVPLSEGTLKLTGGLRYDQNLTYGPQLTGRLAVVKTWSEDLVTKLLYGSAFKAPAPLLLYSRPLLPGGLVGNPDLAPQLVHTFEAHASYRIGRYLNLTSGLAYSRLINKAELEPQGLNQAAKNIATVQALSSETRLEALVRDSFRGYLSLDLQRTFRDLGQDGYLKQLVKANAADSPRAIVRFGASQRQPVGNKLSLQLNVEGRWVSARAATDSNVFEAGRVYSLAPYFDIGASVGVVQLFLTKGLETNVFVRATDLFDSGAADPGYDGIDYARVGRELFLELRQEL